MGIHSHQIKYMVSYSLGTSRTQSIDDTSWHQLTQMKHHSKLQVRYHRCGHILAVQHFESVIPKSCHHHVIKPLTYLLSLNPSTWSGNPFCFSFFHENTQHRAFPFIHERYLARTAYPLLSISGAIAYGP